MGRRRLTRAGSTLAGLAAWLFALATVSAEEPVRGIPWKGDHVELYIDTQPDLDPGRSSFGQGQFQLAISPGNFQQTGDLLADCVPEMYCHRPEKGAIEGALAAAVRSGKGWTVEAAIPWSPVARSAKFVLLPWR